MKHIFSFSLSVLGIFLLIQPLQAQMKFYSSLTGTEAGTPSQGHASFFASLSSDLKTLTYQVTFSKLDGNYSGAHFHFGPTGGVIHPISFNGNTAMGTWTDIPDTLIKYFIQGGIYVNIHSSTYPAGEIRGTLHYAQVLFPIALDSTFENSNSTALGTGWLRIREDTIPTLEYDITFSGLSAPYTAMHFHASPSGKVLHPLSTLDSLSTYGTWTSYPDSVLKLLVQGNLYVNVHSTLHPGGEIRGTLMPGADIPFVAVIDGQQAGTASAGRGTAWAELSSDLSAIRYSVTYANLEGNYSASHFHTSVDGSVIHPVSFSGNTSIGQWTGFSDVNLEDLLRGRVYVNIHSSVAPGGEISGFLKLTDKAFLATLDGTQSGTGSSAKGTSWLYFNDDNSQLLYRATFSGLMGKYTVSHFHVSPKGSVVYPVSFPDTATSTGSWPIADSLITDLLTGNIYLNVHSTMYPAGEIRGNFNLVPPTIAGVENNIPLNPQRFSLEQNYPNPFNPSTTINYQLARSGFISLKVYDLLGRNISTIYEGYKPAGTYHEVFDARNLASGIYFYRLTGDNFSQVKKMLLLK